ncbi:MAG: intradiol ring-cleavage dioxygenase [Bacteroidia bacterium]
MISCLRNFIVIFSIGFLACNNQQSASTVSVAAPGSVIGGGCDGCELMYIGMPDTLLPESTSKGWQAEGDKLIITGRVLETDGKTPAAGVIIYYWHTDNNGFYSPGNLTDERVKPHGYLRGWIKTDAGGTYTIRTMRPAPYANDVIPAHIHLSIKEPELPNEYYADLYFDDDPKLIQHHKKYKPAHRAGSEILRVVMKGDTQLALHDVILGLNIPNYPKAETTGISSGFSIGEDQPSFIPFHAWGSDKGSRACPTSAAAQLDKGISSYSIGRGHF